MLKRIALLILIFFLLGLVWEIQEAVFRMRPDNSLTRAIVRLDEGEHRFYFSVSSKAVYAVAIVERDDRARWKRVDSSTSGVKGHLVISDPSSKKTLIEDSFEDRKSFRVPRRMDYRKLEMIISIEFPDRESEYVYLRIGTAL